MSNRNRSKIATCVCRLLPLRRFARQQEGSAAIEFGLVAVPFIALTFAILETALVFFAGQTLETAASEAGRLIMTGQAQAAGYSQGQFKTQVCNFLAGGLFDCTNGVYVDVKTYNDFTSVNNTAPVSNGTFDTSKMNYQPSSPGCIVTVTLYYQWPIYVTLFGDNLTNLNGGSRLLAAASVFRNEPFGPSAPCV
jgi:Flp pilus assembly protein TadG